MPNQAVNRSRRSRAFSSHRPLAAARLPPSFVGKPRDRRKPRWPTGRVRDVVRFDGLRLASYLSSPARSPCRRRLGRNSTSGRLSQNSGFGMGETKRWDDRKMPRAPAGLPHLSVISFFCPPKMDRRWTPAAVCAARWFTWPPSVPRIFPGSESRESRRNVRLLSRNRVVTAMAGPTGIPGRGTRKNACHRRGGAVG